MLTLVALTVPSAPGCPPTATLTPGWRSAEVPATVLVMAVSALSWTLVSSPVFGLWIVMTLPLTAVIWPLLQRSQVLVLLATLGLSLILEQLATNFLGGDTKIVQPPLSISIPLGTVRYPVYNLIILGAGIGILVLGYFALQYTRYGIWLRAVAQNRPMAAALGVPVPRVYVLALVVSSGLSALAGGLLLPLTSVYPLVGGDVILNAFIVVVAGGLGNFRGAALISILVGEVQSVGALFISPSLLKVMLFALVILLLLVRSRREHLAVRL